MLYKSSGAFKPARLCRVSLQWSRNKGKVEWLSSRSLTSFKHRYTRLDLSNRVEWALYKVFKRTRLCRVDKSNFVWYTKSRAFEQAFIFLLKSSMINSVKCSSRVGYWLTSSDFADLFLLNFMAFMAETSWTKQKIWRLKELWLGNFHFVFRCPGVCNITTSESFKKKNSHLKIQCNKFS